MKNWFLLLMMVISFASCEDWKSKEPSTDVRTKSDRVTYKDSKKEMEEAFKNIIAYDKLELHYYSSGTDNGEFSNNLNIELINIDPDSSQFGNVVEVFNELEKELKSQIVNLKDFDKTSISYNNQVSKEDKFIKEHIIERTIKISDD